MLCKTILPTLVTLVCICGVSARPQATATLPFMVADDLDVGSEPGSTSDDEIFSGVIVGTGADGETTYILSIPATASDDTAITVTLVENASQANAIVALSDDSVTYTESIGCGFSGSSADCTLAVAVAADSTTITETTTSSGNADHIVVVVSTSAASPSQTGAGTITGTGSGTSTNTAAGSGSTQSSSAGRNTVAGMIAGAASLVLAAFAMA